MTKSEFEQQVALQLIANAQNCLPKFDTLNDLAEYCGQSVPNDTAKKIKCSQVCFAILVAEAADAMTQMFDFDN